MPATTLVVDDHPLTRDALAALLAQNGFDAHTEDPLALMNVSEDGFRQLAHRCAALAPRVAAVLEGGYNVRTLPRLVEAALEGFTTS